MSRPRKPFGSDHPGRMPALTIRVLAAEMSDQQRLGRGKRLHADDAVIDIVVGHGTVTAEVQGSRYDPYVVTIEADPGEGVPAKRELWAQCTCPDDAGIGTSLCKHAVAAMFALSDEISLSPDLVERWRARRRRRPARDGVAEVTELSARRRGDLEPGHDSATGADVIPLRGRGSEPEAEPEPEHDPTVDAIPMLLRAPAGAAPPELPVVEPIDHASLPDRLIRDVLDDALDHLHLRWE